MKNRLFILLLAPLFSLFCQATPEVINIKQDYNYISIGAFAPIPVVALGIGKVHFFDKKIALDTNVNISTLYQATHGNIQSQIRIYFLNNTYTSIGVSAGGLVCTKKLDRYKNYYFGPCFSFGHDINRQFVEGEIFLYRFKKDINTSLPVIMAKYGIKF